MNENRLRDRLLEHFSMDFHGWDFSMLKSKMVETSLPWDYPAIVREKMMASEVMLDMGTGGGEFLDSIEKLPGRVFATEGYGPNLEIARDRLEKRGIEVRQVLADNRLPFDGAFFDLVINRHEEYSVAEVHRVLKPSGLFVTQQVGGLNDLNLNTRLGAPVPQYLDWCLFKAVEDLKAGGFDILLSDEILGQTTFNDIGSIVYYLKCIPWQIEDFSIDRYLKRLKMLNDFMIERKSIDFINHRFIVIACRQELTDINMLQVPAGSERANRDHSKTSVFSPEAAGSGP